MSSTVGADAIRHQPPRIATLDFSGHHPKRSSEHVDISRRRHSPDFSMGLTRLVVPYFHQSQIEANWPSAVMVLINLHGLVLTIILRANMLVRNTVFAPRCFFQQQLLQPATRSSDSRCYAPLLPRSWPTHVAQQTRRLKSSRQLV